MEKTDRIVEIAREWIGTPFHHQGSVRGVGCDCVGLVRGVYRELYGVEPPALVNYSLDWGDADGKERLVETAEEYLERVPKTDMSKGDVVLIRWKASRVAKHAMILTEDRGTRAIHAINRNPVAEVYLNDAWRKLIVHVFRFKDQV